MRKSGGLDPFLLHVPHVPGTPTIAETEEAGGLESYGPDDGGLEAMPIPFGTPGGPIDEPPEAPPLSLVPALIRLPHADAKVPALSEQIFVQNHRLGNVLSCVATKEALGRISQEPGFVVEVSRDAGTWELATSVTTVRGRNVATIQDAEAETSCIVALIDGGIDWLHEAFLDKAGKTRILWVWDQTIDGKQHPATAFDVALRYGTLYSANDIASRIAANERLPGLRDRSHEHVRHGTHVASIAAGRAAKGADTDDTLFQGGLAPGARIVIVIPKLHTDPGDRQSIGYSKGHVDALRFIEEVAKKERLPVVVNVSAGMSAGAHDGTSTLEAAFDAFTGGGRTEGRAIVKSAGNAREKARYAYIDAAKYKQPLELKPDPTERPGPVTVECWFSSADEIEIQVSDSSKNKTPVCSLQSPCIPPAEQTKRTVSLTGLEVSLSYERFHHDNGDSQVLILLTSTAQGGAFTDNVTLWFEGKEVRRGTRVDIWVEGPLQLVKEAKKGRTLTVPGTANTIITVAAGDPEGAQLFDHSSEGPTRDGRFKPEIYAPGDGIFAAMSNTSNQAISLSGTSMAAPHVAGAIALLYSLHRRLGVCVPNAAQTRAALIASAQRIGKWNERGGYGLLDVAGFIEAFKDWRT